MTSYVFSGVLATDYKYNSRVESFTSMIAGLFAILSLFSIFQTVRRNPGICQEGYDYPDQRPYYCKEYGVKILRFDHFCPWIDTAIGKGNAKHFYLSLFYGTSTLTIVSISLSLKLYDFLQDRDMPFGVVYMKLLCLYTVGFIYPAILAFTIYHSVILFDGRTTYEVHHQISAPAGRTVVERISEVLGSNVVLWLLPF